MIDGGDVGQIWYIPTIKGGSVVQFRFFFGDLAAKNVEFTTGLGG